VAARNCWWRAARGGGHRASWRATPWSKCRGRRAAARGCRYRAGWRAAKLGKCRGGRADTKGGRCSAGCRAGCRAALGVRYRAE